MKGLFKNKPRTPAELVRATKELLMSIDSLTSSGRDPKKEEKLAELSRNLTEMKFILYGNSEVEPAPETCAQLTSEIFKDDMLRLMIQSVPKVDLEARKDIRQVVANLQRQMVHSRLIASDYLEKNKDLLDLLVTGYENPDIALHYGTMLRECIRHQTVARYLLDSGSWKRLVMYIELPNFDVASDAAATFKELMTRHKSTVAEYLTKNYDLFFAEYNTKLLESPHYITRRQAAKLLGDILLDRSNTSTMLKYISSKQNLIRSMNLLKEPSKNIQIEAFHVFKLFVANTNKPQDIVNILVANRVKLLRFLGDFTTEKEDEQFDQDKAQVVREIENLQDPNSKGKATAS
ncbi:unnamed protein product [Calypogeia fissa]